MPAVSIHPVFRYTGFLLPILMAGGLLLLTFSVAPASLPWLVAVFVTAGLFLAARRLPHQTELRSAFLAYAGIWCVYLVNVWYLHVDVPRGDAQATQARVDFVARFVALGAICVPVVIYAFALRIARLDRGVFQWIEWAGWGIAVFFSLASLSGRFAEGWYWSGTVWVPTLDGLYGIFSIFAPVYVLLGWCVAMARVFLAPARRWRLQLIYYLIGFVPFSLACLSHLLISSGMQVYPFGGWLFILHFAIIAYAVWVHRLYDVTVILRRSLAYALVSLAMGLIYACALWGSAHLSDAGGGSGGAALLFVLIAGLLVTPLLAHLQRFIDRFFARDEANRRKALEDFSARMATCVHEEEVGAPLCQMLQYSLKTRAVRLFLLEDGATLRLAGSATDGRSASVEVPDAAVEVLRRHLTTAEPETVNVEVALPEGTSTEAVRVTEGREHLLVPVRHQERLLGGLLIEPKRADDPFFPDDRRFADAAAAQASVALVNARSFARIRHLQELTRQTFDGMAAGVLLLDGEGRLRLTNPAARALLGLDGDEGRESGALARLRERQPELAGWLEASMRDGRDQLNCALELNGDSRRSLLGSAHPLAQSDKDERMTLFLLNDVTEYKSMEERLRRQEYLARTGTMIAAINHEIGNVLQPIQTQVRKLAGPPIEETAQRKSVELLQDRTAALDRLLRNLKDFARPIELRVRETDLQELTESVVAELAEQSSAQGVSFKVTLDHGARTCPADGYWLKQVLYNLVRNAVEATAVREDRCVQVVGQAEEGYVVLSVVDNGSGIAPAVKARLFEPFASTKAETGTGLGLSLCRKIIDLHGGSLTAESDAESGTRFTMRLPVRPVPHTADVPSTPHSTSE